METGAGGEGGGLSSSSDKNSPRNAGDGTNRTNFIKNAKHFFCFGLEIFKIKFGMMTKVQTL